jgi:predicted P-loop ATPase
MTKSLKFKPVKPAQEAQPPADGREPQEGGKTRKMSFKTSRGEKIEEYLKEHYSFFYNEIKGKPESLSFDRDEKGFTPMDKFKLNSLKRELNAAGIDSNTQDIKELLESDFCERVNPIKDYFKQLKPWTGEDHIKELCGTVRTTDPERFYEYLKKWLTAVVANVMDDNACKNHTCLVLTGEQGKFKTTWLETLCPKNLKRYLFTGKIKPDNKDVLTLLAECFLINIDDQLKQLNKQDENELKNLITLNFVKYRRPYAEYIDEYPHLASFCASINGKDFLTDITGSRRFLPFEVLSIEISKAQALDMDKVYAQAYHDYKAGARYWFNDDEINLLHEHNDGFRVTSIEEELIIRYFDRPRNRYDATHFYSSAVIKAYLETETRQKLSIKKIGEALQSLQFEKWQQTTNTARAWVYSIIRKSDDQRNAEAIDSQETKIQVE